MVSEPKGSETALTGLLEARSAVFGVLVQIEALGLELGVIQTMTVQRMACEATRTSPNPKCRS
jgi:hypothetical protein